MAFCNNCGAELKNGVNFCGECGARVSSETPVPVRQLTDLPEEKQPAGQPVQPVWAQYVGQMPGQTNGTAPQTFYVPKRPLGKGGGVTMIVFGSILIFSFLCGAISMFASDEVTVAGILSLILTCLAGGVLLLAFGIRKIKNVNRYNANL